MKRISALVVVALALGACAQEAGREFARYYDPQRQFVTNLPAANDLVVIQPQAAEGAPAILSGVVSAPPAPSPSPQTAFGAAGGLGSTTTEPPDQTVFRVIVVTTDGFEDLDAMGLAILSGNPDIDVQIDEPVRIDGHEGRLLVADASSGGTLTASIAAAFTLGRDGLGYIVAAVFPAGDWEAERGDFFRVLESFRTGVPPGLEAVPVVAGSA